MKGHNNLIKNIERLEKRHGEKTWGQIFILDRFDPNNLYNELISKFPNKPLMLCEWRVTEW